MANHGFGTQKAATEKAEQTTLGATFIASTDTMKESRDTETHPLSSKEILDIVTLSASINTNYITVDTHWDGRMRSVRQGVMSGSVRSLTNGKTLMVQEVR